MANKYTTSYAYDPNGNKVDVYIKDGLTYTLDGKRIGAGYTVQTAGGIYKMGEDGKGYKVDSHNTAPVITQPTKTTSQITTPTVTSTPKTTIQSNPTPTVTNYENPYKIDDDVKTALARLEQYNAYKEYTKPVFNLDGISDGSDAYNDALNRKLNGSYNSNNNAFINNTTNFSDMTSNNNTTLNTSNVMLLNPNNPNDGVVYKTNNGMVFEFNGQQVEITEDEFIKFMTEYLGF